MYALVCSRWPPYNIRVARTRILTLAYPRRIQSSVSQSERQRWPLGALEFTNSRLGCFPDSNFVFMPTNIRINDKPIFRRAMCTFSLHGAATMKKSLGTTGIHSVYGEHEILYMFTTRYNVPGKSAPPEFNTVKVQKSQ